MRGKCDEKMYNELKTEIELEKEKLQKDMDRYLEIDTETKSDYFTKKRHFEINIIGLQN